jgi:arabinogalactan oligomer/maltooligosaccharide transport system substrate-binding protein
MIVRSKGFLIGLVASILPMMIWANSASAQNVELTFWEHEFEEVQKALDSVIADYQKANPNVKIKRSHYKTEDLRTQFQTAAMGGGGADVVLAPNDFAGPFSIMQIIQPVQKWGNLSRFGGSVVNAVSDKNGDVWGLPVSRGNHLLLLVNKKLVPKTPATIEELVTTAKSLSKPDKGQYGFAYNLNEPFWFVAFLGAYGQAPLVKAQPNLDGRGMIDALTLVHDLKFKDKVVPPDCDYNCAETLFVEGKVGMIINGDWSVQKYKDALGKDLEISALPKSAATGKFMAPMISGKYLFFNAKLKAAKLEEAKKFAEYLVSKPVQEKMTKETQRLPAIKELDGSAVIAGDPTLKSLDQAMANGQPMPMEVEMRAIWDAMRPQLQAVMANRAQPKDAAALMQKDAVTKIKEMKN